MYNRYIPQPDGSFQRNRMEDMHVQKRPETHCSPSKPQETPIISAPCIPTVPETHKNDSVSHQVTSITGFLRNLLPKGLDTGDLLVILLMLLMAGDCEEDKSSALLTLALYLFM